MSSTPISPQLQPRASSLPSPPLMAQQQACEAISPRLKRSRQPSADGPAGDSAPSSQLPSIACQLCLFKLLLKRLKCLKLARIAD